MATKKMTKRAGGRMVEVTFVHSENFVNIGGKMMNVKTIERKLKQLSYLLKTHKRA